MMGKNNLLYQNVWPWHWGPQEVFHYCGIMRSVTVILQCRQKYASLKLHDLHPYPRDTPCQIRRESTELLTEWSPYQWHGLSCRDKVKTTWTKLNCFLFARFKICCWKTVWKPAFLQHKGQIKPKRLKPKLVQKGNWGQFSEVPGHTTEKFRMHK